MPVVNTKAVKWRRRIGYKKLCKNWYGSCPDGANCKNIHHSNEFDDLDLYIKF